MVTERRECEAAGAGEGDRRRPWAEAALIALLAAAAATLCVTGNMGSGFWWTDAARHAMDGVFMLDFLRDLPASLSVYRYATEYYARYPSLGLVHYPPVFPAVEAVLFALLGVSVSTARIAVSAFAALGAVFGYMVARRFVGRWGAAVFVLLLITAPGIVYWSRDIMLETPMLAMMLVSSHYFLRYVDDDRRGSGVAAALLGALAILTKQTACCLLPAWAAYALWRRGWQILWKRESVLGAALAAVLLVPFAVATGLFAKVNIGQSIGGLSAGLVRSRWSLESLVFYPSCLPHHVGMACLLAIAVLLATGVARRIAGRRAFASPAKHRGIVFAALWAASCYAIMTLAVILKEPRHMLIWAPAMALLGASGFAALAEGGRLARVIAGAATLLLVVQVALCASGRRHDPWAQHSPCVRGTEAPAQWLAGSPAGTVVLYVGTFNGNFIFNMRRLDRGRRVVVLRDSKMLFSMAGTPRHGLMLHAAQRQEILELLRDYGVRYLLVEDPAPENSIVADVRQEVRALAESELFAQRADYPMSAVPSHLSRRLLLYEFLDAGPARKPVLTIPMQMTGSPIRVPLERLGVPVRSQSGAGGPSAPQSSLEPKGVTP